MKAEIHDDMDAFHDNRPCFFKLIFEGANTEHLRIPQNFVKHLPRKLPYQAILRGSCGDEWHVKLCKTAEDIVIEDGWKQYFEDHSLGDNEFLLFKYNGDMSFDVIIFGKDSCERVYDHTINKQIPHDEANQQKKFKGKGIQRTPTQRMDSHLKFNEEKGKKRKADTEKSNGSKSVESFTSDFPFFKMCMKKHNVEKGFLLRVPTSFAREHLPPQGTTKIVLLNSEDKSWEVNYVRNGSSKVLSKGLKAFVRENKLKIGDMCIFELVAKKKIRVHFFPKI